MIISNEKNSIRTILSCGLKYSFLLLILTQLPYTAFCQDNFNKSIINSERVKTAYQEKQASATALLNAKNIKGPFDIFIRAFKNEQELEVWAKQKTSKQYTLIKTYTFCKSSGTLGPKRNEGDLQTPEGFYYINVYNPQSDYYLSLGVNYPNTSDLKFNKTGKPGGDIYIHGKCVTIGCIPITDDNIKELFVLTTQAKTMGQNSISVHIFPYRMNEKNNQTIPKQYPQFGSFWKNLRPGYNYFEKHKQLPSIKVATNGDYLINGI